MTKIIREWAVRGHDLAALVLIAFTLLLPAGYYDVLNYLFRMAVVVAVLGAIRAGLSRNWFDLRLVYFAPLALYLIYGMAHTWLAVPLEGVSADTVTYQFEGWAFAAFCLPVLIVALWGSDVRAVLINLGPRVLAFAAFVLFLYNVGFVEKGGCQITGGGYSPYVPAMWYAMFAGLVVFDRAAGFWVRVSLIALSLIVSGLMTGASVVFWAQIAVYGVAAVMTGALRAMVLAIAIFGAAGVAWDYVSDCNALPSLLQVDPIAELENSSPWAKAHLLENGVEFPQNARAMIWPDVFAQGFEAPLLGHGIVNERPIVAQTLGLETLVQNQYLSWWLDTGAIGLMLGLMMILTPLYFARRWARETLPQAVVFSGVIGLSQIFSSDLHIGSTLEIVALIYVVLFQITNGAARRQPQNHV